MLFKISFLTFWIGVILFSILLVGSISSFRSVMLYFRSCLNASMLSLLRLFSFFRSLSSTMLLNLLLGEVFYDW